MAWQNHYLPPNPSLWQGRADIPANSCFFQVIKLLDLRQSISKDPKPSFVLLGFRCDEGIRRNQGRTGAIEGPIHLRKALAKFPIQREVTIYDAGDITCTESNLESAQQALAETVALLLQAGMTPIIIGGGHELAWGHYQGIVKCLMDPRFNGDDNKLAIVNFDAHFDMRPLLPNKHGSSGTPFLQIAEACQTSGRHFDYHCIGIQPAANIPLLFDTAKKYDVKIITAEKLHENDKEFCQQFIHRIIKENKIIYLSLCLDVFAAAFAPGVSAPQALGLTPWQVMPLVRELAASGKVISYDLAELSPPYDKDDRTAKLAANFVYEIIHHHVMSNTK